MADLARVRAHVRLSGRVQGVGFRDFVWRQAGRLGVAGFVRNLPDRGLEIVAEGTAGDVRAVIEAARIGPPGAIVHTVHVEWEAPRDERGFVIRSGGGIHD